MEVRVEGRKDPIGISRQDLRFGWTYQESEAAFGQKGYRIAVAEDEGQNRLLWDSGYAESKESRYIPCEGESLPEMKKLWLSVTTKDENGGEKGARTSFVLAPSDWKAEWIWKDRQVNENDYLWCRKRFVLDRPVKEAYISVSAHNHYILRVNGERVGGYVSPAPTNFQKDKRFLTYEITEQLREGENFLESDVHYLGGGGQNYEDGFPGFICQCRILFEDGSEEWILTDESWECAGLSPYRLGMPCHQNRRMSSVECYDASVRAGEQEWSPAVLVTDRMPKNIKPQQVPEGWIDGFIEPVKLESPDPAADVYDTGVIVTGWVKITASGQPGTKVRIRYSEDLDERGRVRHNVCNETSETYYDEYIMGGEDEEEWMPCFSFKAFRYFEVEWLNGRKGSVKVQVADAHTKITLAGGFFCDNQLLTDIARACIRTQKNNTVGQMVDCPHREQAQYLADSDLHGENFLYNFQEPEMMEKVLKDFSFACGPDGTYPFVYPCNYEREEFALKIPEYDTHFITILWKLYGVTGDKAYLSRYYDTAKCTLEGYLAQRTGKGVVPKSKEWHISDWPYPVTDQEGSFLAAENMKLCNDVRIMAEAARILGIVEDEKRYERIGGEYRAAVRAMFLDPKRGLFKDCDVSAQYSKGVNALALHLGFFQDEEKKMAARYLAEGELTTSTIFTLDLLKALFENGEGEAAYRILSGEGEKSWGRMIRLGYGTIWEGWQNIESHCHAWNAYPVRIMEEYLAGVRCVEPGFKTIALKPYFPEGISWMKASVYTPSGTVKVEWSLGETKELKVLVPYGIRMMVYLPDGEEYRFLRELDGGEHCVRF